MTILTRVSENSSSVRLYRLLVLLGVPLRWWVRIQVSGGSALPPANRAVLVVANHDSMLDPLAIADTLMRAGRPIRFLAMERLWHSRVLARILDGVRQIPIRRGQQDIEALQAAVDALAGGDAVCIFPEGRLSRGQRVRARSGVGRLIEACPDADVVLAAVAGGTDLVRFPRRPKLTVELFRPQQPVSITTPKGHSVLAERLLGEIRERVPPVAAGRRSGHSHTGP